MLGGLVLLNELINGNITQFMSTNVDIYYDIQLSWNITNNFNDDLIIEIICNDNNITNDIYWYTNDTEILYYVETINVNVSECESINIIMDDNFYINSLSVYGIENNESQMSPIYNECILYVIYFCIFFIHIHTVCYITIVLPLIYVGAGLVGICICCIIVMIYKYGIHIIRDDDIILGIKHNTSKDSEIGTYNTKNDKLDHLSIAIELNKGRVIYIVFLYLFNIYVLTM